MRGYTTADKIRYWLFQDKIPLAKIIILCNAVTFLAIALFKLDAISVLLSFSTPLLPAMPWTALTYPLVWATPDAVGLLFSGYWLWVAGGSLERAWGTVAFGIYFFLMCAISALALYAGTIITGIPVELINLWLPIAGVTVAFGMMNPEQQILFFFVIPLKLKYLALLDVVIVLVQYGQINLLLGVLALAGCAFSYLYVVRPIRLPESRRESRGQVMRVYGKSRRSMNPLRWVKEYKDRQRLKKLFDKSFPEDNDYRQR
jgi:membrane associated rhomboid family serine protease